MSQATEKEDEIDLAAHAGLDVEFRAETIYFLILDRFAALFKTPCKLAVLMCSDLLGVPLRFNLPGSYGVETWCARLDHPFQDYADHAILSHRIADARRLIAESGRGLEGT